jgi:hypothetical protein
MAFSFNHPVSAWERETSLDYAVHTVAEDETSLSRVGIDGTLFKRGVSTTEIVRPASPLQALKNKMQFWEIKAQLAEDAFKKLKRTLTEPNAPPVRSSELPKDLNFNFTGDPLADLKELQELVLMARDRVNFYRAVLSGTDEELRREAEKEIKQLAADAAIERSAEIATKAREITI